MFQNLIQQSLYLLRDGNIYMGTPDGGGKKFTDVRNYSIAAFPIGIGNYGNSSCLGNCLRMPPPE
jgi:hypothetical protein